METIVGSIGVGMLLVAFVLNLINVVSENSLLYLLMNMVGAFLAVYYALASGSYPFVILELVWGMAALIRLLLNIKKGSQTTA